MVTDDKGKGKAFVNDKETTIKELNEHEHRINIVEAIFSKFRDKKLKDKDLIILSNEESSLKNLDLSDSDSSNDSGDSSENLINFMVGRDLKWQFAKQSQETKPKPLDVAYPHAETASSSRGTNTRCQEHYALRSLRHKQEEDDKHNAVVGLKAPKK
ncbi:hypothetical protein Tco_0299952 [Tanacetum coccineum]